MNDIKKINGYNYDHYYKPFFEKIQSYIPVWITPNMITIISFLLINILYYFKLYYNPFIFSLFIFLYWSLDNLDGIHARNTNQTSTIGEFLDHGFDMYIVIIGFFIICNYFNIKINVIIVVLITFICNIIHLIVKYTNVLNLNKLINLDDTLVFLIFLPFLKYIPYFTKWFRLLLYPIIFAIFIYIYYTDYLPLLSTIKWSENIILLILCIIYYNICNPYIIGFIQMLYQFYLIYTKNI